MSKQEMLINFVPGEECRIAVVKDNRLEELYQERASAESHVGNIYKARVTNVEPSIQAAFVDFGLERNGFLHISDLHPKYFPGDAKEQSERVGKKTPRRDRPPIQNCLRRGQDMLVQVLKEGIGTKGPTLTSYLSIPGRFLVMMPDMKRLGVSRKIDDDEIRRATRKLLDELKPPDDFGFIVRTAGIGRPKAELKRDLSFLQRLWKAIETRMDHTQVGELYTESDLVIRTIRDVLSSDIDRIIIDDESAAKRARDFLRIVNPRSSLNVVLYDDTIPVFHRYKLEEQIDNINARTVPLPSGGSLVIEQTEALVAIDVNSGKMRENRDAETTAFKTNVEAADEICRQLRLRDLGGVIINDLIDMRQSKCRREIEQRFRDNLKRDRARTRILSISQLGILEMTRQRMRPSLSKAINIDCRHCQGTGRVMSPESVVLDVMRRLALLLSYRGVAKAELTVSPDVAFQLLNRKRTQLVDLEQRHNKLVMVRVNDGGPIDFIRLSGLDERGGEVDIQELESAGAPDVHFAEISSEDHHDREAAAEQTEKKSPVESSTGPHKRGRTTTQPDAATAHAADHRDRSVTKQQPKPAASSDRKHDAVEPKKDGERPVGRTRGRRNASKAVGPSKRNDASQKSAPSVEKPPLKSEPSPISRGYHNRRPKKTEPASKKKPKAATRTS